MSPTELACVSSRRSGVADSVRRAVPLVPGLPSAYSREQLRIRQATAAIEGFLKPKEIDFLSLVAACPTAEGCILEIGSFRGRSTAVLALGSRLADAARVIACDPLPEADGRDQLVANLARVGVSDAVEVRQQYSYDLARAWTRPIRLLWIDGDHSYASSRRDFELFVPFLAPGAIVAMHDCLQPSDGPLRIFIEEMVLSPRFARVGLCGSIGWGRYLPENGPIPEFDARMSLYSRLARLVPFHLDVRPQSFLRRKLYLLYRLLVPHGAVVPETWIASLGPERNQGTALRPSPA